MRKILYIICATLLLVACDKNPHLQCIDDFIILDEDMGKDLNRGLVVGFNTDSVTGTEFRDLNIFFFDKNDELVRHNYFTNLRDVANTKLPMLNGEYTIFAVFNTEPDFLAKITKANELPELYLSGLISEVNGYYDDNMYPLMLTGMKQATVDDAITQAIIYVGDTPITELFTLLSLDITYPSAAMQPYTKAATEPQLRVVVEAYKSGTSTCVARRSQLASEDINLSLAMGKYDIRVWSDYTKGKREDLFYNTSVTDNITLSKTNYTACSDYRAAYAGKAEVEIEGDRMQQLAINLYRPQAAYRVIANDVNDFFSKTGCQEGKFDARVTYGFFFPLGYNLSTGKPCSSEAGVSYTSTVTIEKNEANEALIACDYIFVNGTESFVSLTIEILDEKGEVLSGVKGLRVPYKRDHLTTITADVLTSELEGGIDIDTEWGDDIYVDLDDLF